jgi:hypothetical protein
MTKKISLFIIFCSLVFVPLAQVNADSLIPKPIVPSCNVGPLVPVKGPDGTPLKKLDSEGKPLLDGNGQEILTGEKNYAEPCNFVYVIKLINNIIKFLLFAIAGPLAALGLIYAGFQLLTSGGSSEAKTKAKSIIKNIIIGYIVALAAWLIINTIFVTFGFKGETYLHPPL